MRKEEPSFETFILAILIAGFLVLVGLIYGVYRLIAFLAGVLA